MPDRITHDVLAEIVGIASDAVICMDAFQRITFFNTGAEAIFGYKSDEIIGQRIETLIPERFRTNHASQVAEFGRSGVKARRMGERREIAAVRKNGAEFPAEAAISQVHQGGEVIFAVVLRDVTIRKRFEQRQQFLAQAGEKLASSFGSTETLGQVARLAVPVIADGCILENRMGSGFLAGAAAHVDPEIEQILDEIGLAGPRIPPKRHPLADILEKPSPVLLQTDAASRLLEASANPAYLKAMKAMNPESALFLPLVAREQLIGALTLFRTKGTFDGDDLGFAEDLARLAALALDNARLHDAVRASLRARDEMVGVVSHDLRNPVAAIKMLSGTLLRDPVNAGGPTHESIELICQAAEQMDALIRDLLDVNRLDAGKLVVSLAPVDPSTLLTDSLQTLRPLVAEKGIALDLQIETPLPMVIADPDRIQQTLSNLVGNAIKFSPSGSKIVVIARKDPQAVVISVIDNGKGIAPEQLPRVFDRNWQSSRTDRQGAGLGLAISKGIVEAHGGKIWIESKQDQGTIASFTLLFA
ncbi:MAG TPA: PAS domain-containing sensor histidine kinase [Gemmatimonadaceae bacterium]|nr:PAS domain-containing sensor histidine kinase [Gemmatimonadaceae bacterium]